MYRQKDRIRKTSQQVKPWSYAAKIKKAGFPTAVHAVASMDIEAYYFILNELKDRTSLEMIMAGLWKNFPQALERMEKLHYGSLSPNSLLTFKRNYWDTKRLPDIEKEKNIKYQMMQLYIKSSERIKKAVDKIRAVEKRVGIPTRLGDEQIERLFDCNKKILDLQIQLGIIKPILR